MRLSVAPSDRVRHAGPSRSPGRRPARLVSCVGIGMTAAMLLSGVVVSCSDETLKVTSRDEPGSDEVAAPRVETLAVEWDLQVERESVELKGFRGRQAFLEMPDNGIDLRLVLPGGEVVDGRWTSTSAMVDPGADIEVSKVTLVSAAEAGAPLQKGRIDEFIERFGADRDEIEQWVDSALAAAAEGAPTMERRFAGRATPGYVPTLLLWVTYFHDGWPSEGDPPGGYVGLGWEFDLVYGPIRQ